MSSLGYVWRPCIADDLLGKVRGDARPKRPGEALRLNGEMRALSTVKKLDKHGPEFMSDAGFEKVQMLLKAAQSRPARPKVRKKKQTK